MENCPIWWIRINNCVVQYDVIEAKGKTRSCVGEPSAELGMVLPCIGIAIVPLPPHTATLGQWCGKAELQRGKS